MSNNEKQEIFFSTFSIIFFITFNINYILNNSHSTTTINNNNNPNNRIITINYKTSITNQLIYKPWVQ